MAGRRVYRIAKAALILSEIHSNIFGIELTLESVYLIISAIGNLLELNNSYKVVETIAMVQPDI